MGSFVQTVLLLAMFFLSNPLLDIGEMNGSRRFSYTCLVYSESYRVTCCTIGSLCSRLCGSIRYRYHWGPKSLGKWGAKENSLIVRNIVSCFTVLQGEDNGHRRIRIKVCQWTVDTSS